MLRYLRRVRSVAGAVVETPRWVVLRLATVTGVNAGWWIMAIASAVTGAVTSVVVTTVVHSALKEGRDVEVVPSEVRE
jgi:hypothetical protein